MRGVDPEMMYDDYSSSPGSNRQTATDPSLEKRAGKWDYNEHQFLDRVGLERTDVVSRMVGRNGMPNRKRGGRNGVGEWMCAV